jgi:hypothetical protein
LSQKDKNARSQAWFIHVQVEIKYVLMSLYDGSGGSSVIIKKSPTNTAAAAAAGANGGKMLRRTSSQERIITTTPTTPSSVNSPSPSSSFSSLSSPPLERKQSNRYSIIFTHDITTPIITIKNYHHLLTQLDVPG